MRSIKPNLFIILNCFYFAYAICREKKREKEREELWKKLHDLELSSNQGNLKQKSDHSTEFSNQSANNFPTKVNSTGNNLNPTANPSLSSSGIATTNK